MMLASKLHFLRNPVRDIGNLTRKIDMMPGSMTIDRRKDDIKYIYTSNGYLVGDAIFSLKSGECSIYVEDHLQGRGIGKQILEQVRRELISHGVPSITWSEYGWNPIRPLIPGFQQICFKPASFKHQRGHNVIAVIDPNVVIDFKWSEKENKMIYKDYI